MTMASFVLIPGAGGAAWYWHRVVPLLEGAGHEVVAVDLPGDDGRAGIDAYARIVVEAIGSRTNVVLVAQSMGAFTAALACRKAPASVGRLVFVNPMIPMPGETAGEWWSNTHHEQSRVVAAEASGYSPEFDVDTYFMHDVPKDVKREGSGRERAEAKVAFEEPCRFERWPDVPIDVVIGRDDRFFPAAFQLRMAQERLGRSRAIVHEVPGGHLVALSNPQALADQLLALDG